MWSQGAEMQAVLCWRISPFWRKLLKCSRSDPLIAPSWSVLQQSKCVNKNFSFVTLCWFPLFASLFSTWLCSVQHILRSCAGQSSLPAHYTGLSDHHSHVLYSVVQKAADILRLLCRKSSKLSIQCTGLSAHHAHAQIFRKMRLYDTIQQVA